MESLASRIQVGWITGMVAAMVAVAAVVFSASAEGAGPSPSPIPQGCQLRAPQPEAPLKLNLVAVQDLAKTIAMEKEIFDCYDAKSTLTQIKDLETFIEVIDRTRGGGTKQKHDGGKNDAAAGVSVSAVTCTKDLTSGRVSCRTDPVPLGVTQTPLARCSTTRGTYPFAPLEQPTHPVEMRSTAVGGGAVRTVKVEKEVFDCGGRIADLYVFTNRVATVRGDSFGPATTRFSGVVCFKDEAKAQVAECKLFAP